MIEEQLSETARILAEAREVGRRIDQLLAEGRAVIAGQERVLSLLRSAQSAAERELEAMDNEIANEIANHASGQQMTEDKAVPSAAEEAPAEPSSDEPSGASRPLAKLLKFDA
jgi:hypothetical protein